MTIEAVDQAFRDALTALDRAWQAVVEHRNGTDFTVDTLSHSLADPRGFAVAVMLHKLIAHQEYPEDAQTIRCIFHTAHAAGLLSESAYTRLLKDLAEHE